MGGRSTFNEQLLRPRKCANCVTELSYSILNKHRAGDVLIKFILQVKTLKIKESNLPKVT